MDNCTAYFFLADYGGICAMANTSFTWINETGKVEQAIYHLKEKAMWLEGCMVYGICFLGLGGAIRIPGSKAFYMDY